METVQESYSRITYDGEGDVIETATVDLGQLNRETLADFEKRLSRISGDLELPLEGRLPGKFEHLEFRVGSDLNGAYVLYYLHDEVVVASLLLKGQDELNEIELTQVFKFLLLDDNDADEPTEDEIEEVLASTAFDFSAATERPIAHLIRFSQRPDERAQCEHIEDMDRYVAAAFLFGPK